MKKYAEHIRDDFQRLKPLKKILVVEDNLIYQRFAQNILFKMNYAADIAENGKKALEFYSKNDYFAILMDLDLPDISGIDITRKIRKIESIHKKRTIIVASTSRGKEATQSCFEAGMDDFMSKPFKAELLDEILKKF